MEGPPSVSACMHACMHALVSPSSHRLARRRASAGRRQESGGSVTKAVTLLPRAAVKATALAGPPIGLGGAASQNARTPPLSLPTPPCARRLRIAKNTTQSTHATGHTTTGRAVRHGPWRTPVHRGNARHHTGSQRLCTVLNTKIQIRSHPAAIFPDQIPVHQCHPRASHFCQRRPRASKAAVTVRPQPQRNAPVILL